MDSATNLYVADSYNCTIRKLTPVGTNWVVTTIAGTAYGFGSNDGINGAAQFYLPDGLAVDRGGNVYVADYYNNTLRIVSPVGTNWVVGTIGGSASNPAGSADGTNNIARFNQPWGIAVNNSGNLFLTDSANHTIRRGTLPAAVSPPVIQTVGQGGGKITFTWSAVVGRIYQVGYRTNLAQSDWISLGGTVTATNATMTTFDTIGPVARHFYRVALLP